MRPVTVRRARGGAHQHNSSRCIKFRASPCRYPLPIVSNHGPIIYTHGPVIHPRPSNTPTAKSGPTFLAVGTGASSSTPSGLVRGCSAMRGRSPFGAGSRELSRPRAAGGSRERAQRSPPWSSSWRPLCARARRRRGPGCKHPHGHLCYSPHTADAAAGPSASACTRAPANLQRRGSFRVCLASAPACLFQGIRIRKLPRHGHTRRTPKLTIRMTCTDAVARRAGAPEPAPLASPLVRPRLEAAPVLLIASATAGAAAPHSKRESPSQRAADSPRS